MNLPTSKNSTSIKAGVTGKTLTPAFGYLRVSGHGQLDGDGEERQKATISAFASRKGFEIIRWFFDGAVSGDLGVLDRPKFAEMLALTGPATATVVLVERGDRLGRSLMVCELACMEAGKQGVTILDCSADIDLTCSDAPDRVFLRQIVGAAAQLNKNLAIQRMAAARKRIRESGRRCEGVRPYGNQNDEQLFVVGEILKMRDEEERSWGFIARELRRRKLLTAGGTEYWNRSSVRALYVRETELKAAATGRRVFPCDRVNLDDLPV